MADLQFNEPSYGAPVVEAGPTGITGLVVRWGLAKDARQAQTVLLIVLAVTIVAAIGLFFFGGVSGAARPPAPNLDGTPRTES